ncbi:MAG: type II secretion system F family protein [Nocardioidaceae bacterium]
MLTTVALTVATVLLALSPSSSSRLRRLVAATGGAEASQGRRRWPGLASPRVAAVVAAVAVANVWRSPVGLGIAAVGGYVVFRWVEGLESAEERHATQAMLRDLPLAVDLVVGCLEAGRPPQAALATVGSALAGPLGARMVAISAKLDLGADPLRVWRDVGSDPVLAPMGRSFARAAQSGAAVATTLQRCAQDVRSQQRWRRQNVARSVGVWSAGPLGLCFLPAFMVVGIVPTIVAVFSTLAL